MEHFLLALENFKQGSNLSATKHIQLGLETNPKDSRLLFLAGLIAAKTRDLVKAAEYFEKCCELNQHNYDAVLNLGSVYQELGQLAAAEKQFVSIPQDSSLYVDARLNLAVIHTKNENFTAAEQIFIELRSRKDCPADFSLNYGLFLFQQGKINESIEQYQLAIKLAPHDKRLWLNLSAAYEKLGEIQCALDSVNHSLKIDITYADGWVNRGLLLSRIGDIKKALEAFKRALRLNETLAQGWLGLGAAHHRLGDYDSAKSAYLNALKLAPDLAAALSNLGSICLDQGEYRESIAYSRAAIECVKDYPFSFGNLFFAKMHMGNWETYAKDLDYIKAALVSRKAIATPFVSLVALDDSSLHRISAEVWFNEKVAYIASESRSFPRPKSYITVGYVSSDFGEHAVAYLIAELFELHDRHRFRVVCIGLSAASDGLIFKRIKSSCDLYIDAAEMLDAEVVDLIQQHEVDILIDLNGYTKGARTGIFARRPAPIQVSYVGYLGAMCVSCYQYLIVDRSIVPEKSAASGTERWVYLPTYQINDRKRPLPQSKRRGFLKIDSASNFVFCCLNNNYKLNPNVCSLWVEILNRAPNSSLLLAGGLNEYQENIRDWFLKRSIDQSRVCFLPRTSRDEYLAAYLECDLFLDTFPYNAGVTGSDALWMGVPLISLVGESMPARYGLSLLNGVGLSELAVDSKAEYVELAVALYWDRERLNALHDHLERVRMTAPLFDTPSFVRNLEIAFQNMLLQQSETITKDICL